MRTAAGPKVPAQFATDRIGKGPLPVCRFRLRTVATDPVVNLAAAVTAAFDTALLTPSRCGQANGHNPVTGEVLLHVTCTTLIACLYRQAHMLSNDDMTLKQQNLITRHL